MNGASLTSRPRDREGGSVGFGSKPDYLPGPIMGIGTKEIDQVRLP